MMGISGAAGIGKTTLAVEIYDKIQNQFQDACFVDNVSKISSTHGLMYLQNMLLTQMLGEEDSMITNVDIGASLIKNRFQSNQVLLILDHVDKLEQLEALVGKYDWLGPGSRIIIITRDKHLLKYHGVDIIYEVQPLDRKDALKLLSHHIFKQGKFDSSYTEVLKELVSYASGSPLALKVIGSYLVGKSVEEWESALRRFKRIPPQEIQIIFKTSFDALREDEKSTFLDIACCFQGYELVNALSILSVHRGDEVKLHIDVLKDKSLITISSGGMVTLLPLIEYMGKEIVRQQDPKEPGNRSRLWFSKDIVHVLKK